MPKIAPLMVVVCSQLWLVGYTNHIRGGRGWVKLGHSWTEPWGRVLKMAILAGRPLCMAPNRIYSFESLRGHWTYNFKSEGQGQGYFYFFVLIVKGVSENDVRFFFVICVLQTKNKKLFFSFLIFLVRCHYNVRSHIIHFFHFFLFFFQINKSLV